MKPMLKVDVDGIIAEYHIDVDSTTSIKVEGLKDSTNVFRVDRSDLIEELYIIDSVQGKNIACHPSIVGKTLKTHAFNAAVEAAKAINQLTDLSTTKRDSIVVENVLRGAPGYELHTAFRELNAGRGFIDVWIRTKYEKPSYRIHDDESSASLNVVYEDFDALPHQKDIVLLKPDTEATGKTGQKAIERIVKKCEEVESTIKEIILYGFISIPAIKKMGLPKLIKIFASLVRGKIPDIIEVELSDKNGTQRIYRVFIDFIRVNGKISDILAILIDITEQKKVEVELKKKGEELERFNKMAIGRELKMIELKKKIKELEDKLKNQQG